MSPTQAFQKSLRMREAKRLAAERTADGVSNDGVAAPAGPVLTGLAAQLAGFDGDEEMQLLIIQKWNAKHAPKTEAPAPVSTASAVAPVLPSDDDEDAQIAALVAADTAPGAPATFALEGAPAKGPVGKRGKADLAKETGIPAA
jgi:hypothetical protein